jgi:hypothetical protein
MRGLDHTGLETATGLRRRRQEQIRWTILEDDITTATIAINVDMLTAKMATVARIRTSSDELESVKNSPHSNVTNALKSSRSDLHCARPTRLFTASHCQLGAVLRRTWAGGTSSNAPARQRSAAPKGAWATRTHVAGSKRAPYHATNWCACAVLAQV